VSGLKPDLVHLAVTFAVVFQGIPLYSFTSSQPLELKDCPAHLRITYHLYGDRVHCYLRLIGDSRCLSAYLLHLVAMTRASFADQLRLLIE